jgi:chromate transporter
VFAVVTWQLFRSAVVDWITLALALLSALLLFRTNLNSLWLVLGGALAGLFAQCGAGALARGF